MLMALSFSGCGKKDSAHIEINDEPEVQISTEGDTDRTVTLSELGLKYTTPELWRKYETTNIYPETISSEGTFAQIKYNFITEEGLAALNASAPTTDTASLLTPICQIVVLETANIETVGIQSLFGEYEKSEKVSEQGNYSYYVLSGYMGDKSSFTEEQQTIYNELLSVVPDLVSSVSTFDFNPNDLANATLKLENTLTFDTTTLTGEPVNSTIFANADLTMFHFGATYAPDESEELQKLQDKIITSSNGKLALVTAYVDTPETDTTEEGKKLRSAAKATYPTLVMDETLGTWATTHLNGVPTILFIDKNGTIVGDRLEGARSADEYWALINETLAKLSAQ